MIKELIVNGKLFAKYQILNDTIHLNPKVVIFPDNEMLSEDCLVKIIEQVEGVNFQFASYLNE